jgi:uroporphyrinogen decarboxylase
VFPVPVDVIENWIYPSLEQALARHFGLAAADHEGVLAALGAHTRWGKPAYVGPALEVAPIQPPSSFPNRRATRSIWGSWAGMNTYSDTIARPLAGIESVADVHNHRWPDADWFDYGRIGWFEEAPDQYPTVAAWADRHQEHLRVAGGFEPVFSRIMDLCGMEQGLALTAARPDLIHALVGHIGDFLEEYYRRIAVAGQGFVDVLAFGDDFAGQEGLLLSPRRWREYFLPLWRRLFGIAHRHGMLASLHSCGSVRAVLGDLVDAGLDVLEVVQVSARGMDPAELKREFGAQLAFYGGMDVQQVLPRGTPDEVRAEVRRLATILGRDGRFILANSHLLMDDVPPANVLAMYDEARTYLSV